MTESHAYGEASGNDTVVILSRGKASRNIGVLQAAKSAGGFGPIGVRDRRALRESKGRIFGPSAAAEPKISQLPANLHEVIHFSVHGRLAESQALLQANAGKEGQDHLCECRWFHLVFPGFDISDYQIFEKSVALRNDFLRRAWEYRELAHGID
jgi:hypothetical protein